MSRTNAMSRGRYTAVARAPLGMLVTPNTRMKYVGWSRVIVTRIAVHDPLGGFTDPPPVTSTQVLTWNVWLVWLYRYWPTSILLIWALSKKALRCGLLVTSWRAARSAAGR